MKRKPKSTKTKREENRFLRRHDWWVSLGQGSFMKPRLIHH